MKRLTETQCLGLNGACPSVSECLPKLLEEKLNSYFTQTTQGVSVVLG